MDALNRLSSGIAHDFNNLLTTILGGAELLEHKADSNDPIKLTSSASGRRESEPHR